MPKKILLITDYFPYTKTSETFLETEIKYWSNQKEYILIIMPMHIGSEQRKIPTAISIDNSFANFLLTKKNINTTLYKLLYIIKSSYQAIFWKELITEVISRPVLMKELLFSMRKYEIYKDFFTNYIKENDIEIFYTYWNTEVTYALQDLNKNLNYKVITRVHGYDLYTERTLKNYMPLRKQFNKKIHRVFTITDSAIEYLVKTYGYKYNLIHTSRLGVIDKNIITKASEDNIFHIVSCSSLIPIKRVKTIIDSIYLLAQEQKNIVVKWTHIGDGKLYMELNNYAKKKLNLSNIRYSFLGSLSNQDVYKFYKSNKVDVFLNVSKSEGVPVSIMEAMSCHIPIVAPNIGGISDMVNTDFNGILLEHLPSSKKIQHALKNISYFKNNLTRNNSYQQYKKYFDASINYPNFIKGLNFE